MCSECPYSAKKWMTAFDHMKNSEGEWMKFSTQKPVNNVDKQAYEQLKVSFMKVCVKTHKTCFDVVVVIIVVVAVVVAKLSSSWWSSAN